MSDSRPLPERDVLPDLQDAAARKWKGNPECQQAGLFARAAAEVLRLRVAMSHMESALAAAEEDSARWVFVRDSDSPLWRPFALREGDDPNAADRAVDIAIKRHNDADERKPPAAPT
jgi:hypothetical protein